MQETKETGSYSNGTSVQACEYVLMNDTVYIYLRDEANSLLIWNSQSIINSELKGDVYLFTHDDLSVLGGNGPMAVKIWETLHSKLPVKPIQNRISSKTLSLIFGITLVFLVLLSLLYVLVLPWAGEKAAQLVPIETEIEMGKSLSEIYTGETQTNDSVNFYLTQFTNELQLNSIYPIEVKVILSDEINAFALPGGRIYVYSGILQKLHSSEELVALIAHEVTHVKQRHSLKSICRALASGILLSTVLGDASGASSGILAKADEFKQLDYSRELETEADLVGLMLMKENQINPKGMLDLLNVLKAENTAAPQLMKYLSTHPQTEERIANVRRHCDSGQTPTENKKLDQLFSKIQSNFGTKDNF